MTAADWRREPCRKCKTQVMQWWRYCPFCGQHLPSETRVSVANRALELLQQHGEMTAGELGPELWPDRTGRICSANGGGDYAAQMLLGRLRKAGFVESSSGHGATRWKITSAGRSNLAEADR